MSTYRSMLRALVVALLCGVAGVAHGAVVAPVDTTVAVPPFPPLPAAPVTVSIYSLSGADITATWLPTWRPTQTEQVLVVFNTAGVALDSVTLVPPVAAPVFDGTTNPFVGAALTTSAYPGNCTNSGSRTDVGPDFTLVPGSAAGRAGYLLTSNDCGGVAVIQAVVGGTPYTFVLPQDSDGNGIPDAFQAVFCPSTSPCPTGREDNDTSVGNQANGDGLSAFDEYRGFIVSGVHVRTDPRRKDLFVHVVNPQCVPDPLTSTASLLGGGANTYVGASTLFGNVATLVSDTLIHRLGHATPNATHVTTTEWIDHFARYSLAEGLRFGDGTVTTAPASDRQINANAVFFALSAGVMVPQRGLRIIECVDTSSASIMGYASLGSPNGNDNAVLFTHNIVNYLSSTLGATCATPTTACLSYSTFQNGAWTAPVPISPVDLYGAAFAFYLAMEIGHTVVLTPTVEGDRRTSYGYHHAPGTGSNMDQSITTKVSTKTGKTFYIPQLYNTNDLANYKFK